ncbi:sodium:proton antiporter [Caloramator sp. E03]|uniref:Na+/H+ antiporter subunit E n=1 Tax=Caloramator sp. E03 TaxID=2576307 RepID=UPI0011103198|nr:Na+/H+ antiporter subunit E [Caloramator sp. E03]QCX32605.1 sodium:proton antiporter [Caloramator sp. E03]
MKKNHFLAVISTFILCYIILILFTFAFSFEELLIGAIVSYIVALFTASFFIHDTPFYLFNPSKFVALIKYVFVIFPKELWKANVDVAKCALSPSLPVNPGIVKIPSNLKSEYALSMLANSITLTPGTITMDVAEDRGKNYYYIHCIDVATTNNVKDGEIIKGTLENCIGRIWK